MGKKALEGITVLDLTRVLAGPYCGMILADHGANVIKIEQSGKGDDSRESVPILGGESAYFMCLNRNKKGITLNLKAPKGRQMFLEMVKKADVVLENYRPGVMDKLGLGYDVLKGVNPGIIYASISGFGHTGPYAQWAGFDIVAQAMSGLMNCSGWPDGGPTRAGAPLGDTVAGLNCAIGILMALYHRSVNGKGQKVDIALVDSMVSCMPTINMLYLIGGEQPERMGNRYANAYPYDSFRCSDGDIVLAAPYDLQWEKLCGLMGIPECAHAEDYNCEDARIRNFVKVKALVETWTSSKTMEQNLELLRAGGFACAPIYDLEHVTHDPHIAGEREMFVEVDHPLAGRSTVTNNAVRLSDTPGSVDFGAPTLGQHNAEVFGSLLGMSEAEVSALVEEGVI